MYSPLIDSLIQHFRFLPGVGPKSAERMALYILEKKRAEGKALAQALTQVIERITNCQRCRTLSEENLCRICSDLTRNPNLLCIVETPGDMIKIEQTHAFKGYYFVLMGHLSPLTGVGPKELGIQNFPDYVGNYSFSEMIIATSSTVEGETTAHYLNEQLKHTSIKITRLASGIPLGNDLEFIDHNTLMKALVDRKIFE